MQEFTDESKVGERAHREQASKIEPTPRPSNMHAGSALEKPLTTWLIA